MCATDSRQQALILGHAVPMPVVVRPPTYEDMYADYADFARSLTQGPKESASDLLYND